MNLAAKSAVNAVSHPAVKFSVAFFHASPVSERKRRTHWNHGSGFSSSKKSNYYASRARKDSKRNLLHDISEYAEYLIQSWKDEPDPRNSSRDDDPAWFRGPFYSKGSRKHTFDFHEQQWRSCKANRKGHFDFSSDEDEVETIFRGSFGGERWQSWSFHYSDDFRCGHSNRRTSRNQRYQSEDETDTPQSDLKSERLALGLSASGPLKLEEVKNAYRTCAMRWHPDRHQGSSKAAAEEKFKHCSAAYTQLCDRLAVS